MSAPKPYSDSNSNNKSSQRKIRYDLSKYKEITNKEFYAENIKLYRYSEKEQSMKSEKVYEYFYDEFDLNDFKEAYIILFCGKIGDGKSTSINAFFNYY